MKSVAKTPPAATTNAQKKPWDTTAEKTQKLKPTDHP